MMATDITHDDVKDAAASLFPGGGFRATVQRMRPRICPFELLVREVPDGARVLDIGCGAGLFLGLLADMRRDIEAIGFDANESVIRSAQHMAKAASISDRVSFRHVRVDEAWPEGPFDAVTMVDVMHHLPAAVRPSVYDTIADCLRPEGRFIYKDMARKPFWKAWGNRLHDLVMAREWIEYEPVSKVESECEKRGLSLCVSADETRLWYGHELRVFERRT